MLQEEKVHFLAVPITLNSSEEQGQIFYGSHWIPWSTKTPMHYIYIYKIYTNMSVIQSWGLAWDLVESRMELCLYLENAV